MSIRVYRVSEKTTIHFLSLLQYSEAIDNSAAYNQVRQDHRIDTNHMGFGCRGEYLEYASRVMDYSIHKFTTMEFEHPGIVCRGRMINPTREECSICYEDVPENTYIARMDCGHIFHEQCLLQWIKSGRAMSNNCPKCRREIDSGRILTVTVYDNSCYTWSDITYYDRYRVRI